MTRTVADQMVETLAAAGVERIYGIVGDSLNGFTDALRRHGGIQWLHVRHEEVAAFAAGADAHVTGSLAVWGAHHGFMASFSCSASMSDKPPLRSIWRGEGDRRPKGGRL